MTSARICSILDNSRMGADVEDRVVAKADITGARIISAIVASGADSRADLCENLGLSKASVARAVEGLVGLGLVHEGPKLLRSGPGRRPLRLSPRADLAYVLGADLEGLALRACLLDCSGRMVSSAKRSIDGEWPMGRILQEWVGLMRRVLASTPAAADRLAGLGIGLPGVVSRDGPRIRAYLPPGRWVDVDIGEALSGFSAPVAAANNVICVSEYERRLGAARGADHCVSVLVRYGIGAALFFNGSFCVGEDAVAGELGHVRIDAGGPVCICGQRGCLDVYASGRTLPSPDRRQGSGWLGQLAERGRCLGVGLGGLLKIFHPSMVIVNGVYNPYREVVEPVLLDTLNQGLRPLGLPVPDVVFGEPVDFKASVGAALRAADVFLGQHLLREVFGERAGNGVCAPVASEPTGSDCHPASG